MLPITMALVVSAALQWLLIVLLVRRVRALSELGAAAPLPGLPEAGHVVAPFRCSDISGEPVTTDTLQGQHIFCFFMPGCSQCEATKNRLMELAHADRRQYSIVVVGADVDTASSYTRALTGVARVVAVDFDNPIMDAFGVGDAFPAIVRTVDGVVVQAHHRWLSPMRPHSQTDAL